MKAIQVQTQNVSVHETSSLLNQQLYEQYVSPYTRLIYWICIKHSVCRYYIEDNYQEALTVLYKYIHTYDPERGEIKPWLCTIVSRLVRKQNRTHCNTINDYDLSQIADDYCYYDVESSRRSDYLTNYRLLFSDDILAALEQLNPVYREALLLYLSGYKMREIADISYMAGNLESRNTETVKSRLHMARKHMRRMIDEHGNRRRG